MKKGFDIGEFVPMTLSGARTHSKDENLIYVSTREYITSKGKKHKRMYISFSRKLYNFLEPKEDRVMVCQSKILKRKLILTRSPHGYKIIKQNKNSKTNIVQPTMHDNDLNVVKIMTGCKTILHPKNKQSGSVIEFELPEIFYKKGQH